MRQKGSRKHRNVVSGKSSPAHSYHSGWKVPFLQQFTESLTKWANTVFLKMLQWYYRLIGVVFDNCAFSFLALPLKGSSSWTGSWVWNSLYRKTIAGLVSGSPSLSLHHLILCLETSFTVFALRTTGGSVGSSAVVLPGVAANSHTQDVSCAHFHCMCCSPGYWTANWLTALGTRWVTEPWRQGDGVN